MPNIHRIMLSGKAMKTIPIFCLLFLVACSYPVSHSSIPVESPQQAPTLEELNEKSNQPKAPTPALKTIYPESYPLKLLTTGSFHGENVPAKSSGEKWLGLFSTPKGFELLPTKITVNYFHDPIMDNDETIKTGKEVRINEKLQPIFLVKGSIPLETGIVKTVFAGKTKISPNSQPLSFQLNGEVGDTYQILIEKRRNQETKYHAVLVFLNGIAQEILPCCVERSPELLWAGDLDRDGKLDLLIDLSDHYYASIPTLFLSSPAKQNKIIEPVAQFTIAVC